MSSVPAELAGIRPADTVAVFGAGAVGLLAAYSARLRGASEVYSVNLIPERLDKAAELGFAPVDARQGDPAGQIREAPPGTAGSAPAGVFTTTDAAAPEGGHADGSLQAPWAALFNKGVTSGSGARTTAGIPRTCVT